MGDYDDDGNIIFIHPLCKFCNKNFFDEDKFKYHLQQTHPTCHVCPEAQKYTYYKDKRSLEVHFNASHYLCNVQICKENGLFVFATGADYEAHNLMCHSTEYNK